jgi:hypothetical protein
MPDADDTIRSPKGVVACLRDMGDGTSRLDFDDVTGDSLTNPITWSFESFYTSRHYRAQDLEQLNLTAREYQMIGESLVAGLMAFNDRVK